MWVPLQTTFFLNGIFQLHTVSRDGGYKYNNAGQEVTGMNFGIHIHTILLYGTNQYTQGNES
jgi:hypothetical protein